LKEFHIQRPLKKSLWDWKGASQTLLTEVIVSHVLNVRRIEKMPDE